MYAGQLIGKLAIRIAPIDRGDRENFLTGVVTKSLDSSFTRTPIFILAATEGHIIFRYHPDHDPAFGDKVRTLNYEFCDDKWTSWDDLMSLAEPSNIELLKRLQE